MDNIISTGLSDTQVYLQNAANLKQPFDLPKNSGQYPELTNSTLVNRRLASMWQLLHLGARVFVDGLGVTSMSAEAEGAAGVRIPFLAPAPRRPRTLATSLCPDGTYNGTPGNGGPFNNNLPNAMQTDGVDIWFNQIYDEAAQVSRSQMRMIGTNLDLLGQYTANIPTTTALLEDCEIMANHIGAALARASKIMNGNIVFYNPDTDSDGYLQMIMNTLSTALSNVKGAYKEGIISYPKDKSVYVLRYSFFNKLMTIKNGAIINSDIGQRILLNGKFDDSGDRYLGESVAGYYGGIYIKVVPDEYWDTACAYLNITKAQKVNFDKVVGYIANGIGVYHGRAALTVDTDKAPTTSLGYIVRNDWQWGTKVVRQSAVTLLVESTNNGTDFVNPVTSFNSVIAQGDLEALIQAYQTNSITDITSTLQRVGIGSTSLTTEVKLTVTGTSSAAVKNAKITVQGEGGLTYSVGNNGDGTYSFTVPRASIAAVTISATGYNTATLAVTEANTATADVALTQALTATSK